ncbi:MAG TPA: hypothetical protein VGB13_11625 [Candidatus Krumholzibacteria bacterium]|jgi:hypothetical protein
METYRQFVVVLWMLFFLGILGSTLWFALMIHGEPLVITGGFLAAGAALFITRVAQQGKHGGPLARAVTLLGCIALVAYALPIARNMYGSGVEVSMSRQFARFAGTAWATLAGGTAVLLFVIDALRERVIKGW